MMSSVIETSVGVYHSQYNRLMKNIPFTLTQLIEKHHIIIAGGSITSVFSGMEINDFDLYPLTKASYDNFVKDIDEKMQANKKKSPSNWGLLCNSPNALTYKYDGVVIQVISKFCDVNSLVYNPNLSATDLIESFDFTVCMGALDYKEQKFVLYENFLQDVCQRKLVFNVKSAYPVCALYRVSKYINKGYKISGGEAIKLALSIHNLEMNNYKDLKEQLLGIDTVDFIDITESLIENKGKDAPIDFKETMDLIERSLSAIWEPNED